MVPREVVEGLKIDRTRYLTAKSAMEMLGVGKAQSRILQDAGLVSRLPTSDLPPLVEGPFLFDELLVLVDDIRSNQKAAGSSAETLRFSELNLRCTTQKSKLIAVFKAIQTGAIQPVSVPPEQPLGLFEFACADIDARFTEASKLGLWTAHQVAELTGWKAEVVTHWCREGLLEACLENEGQQVRYLIEPKALAKFQRTFIPLADLAREAVAKEQFQAAIKAANNLPWTSALLPPAERNEVVSIEDQELRAQVEKIEAKLLGLGTTQDRKFSRAEKKILEGLQDNDRFEQAQVDLGELLGFTSGNSEIDAAPDPWWLCQKHGIVFEDYVGAQQDTLGAEKARQAAAHPTWLLDKVEEAKDCEILPVIVAPVTEAHDGAFPHLGTVSFWSTTDFQKWAGQALGVLRELKRTLPGEGDLAWRAEAAQTLSENGLTMEAIRKSRSQSLAKDVLRSV